MKTSILLRNTLITLLCVACAASAQDAQKPATLQQALDQAAAYTFGQSRECLTTVADLVRQALGDAEQTRKASAALSAVLGTDATLDCKLFLCRQLAVCGQPEDVPAIAALLNQAETADMARYALERMQGQEAGQALVAALDTAPECAKVGIINTLGERGCPCAVPALAKYLDSPVPMVHAAIAALGKTGTPEALDALNKAKVPAELEWPLADAKLRCAHRMAAQGQESKAAQVYEALGGYQGEHARAIHVAAFQSLVRTLGAKGVPLVTDVLASDDADLHNTAVTLVRELPGQAATKAFVRQLGKMDAQGQVLLLAALADRGDKSARKAVERATNSKEEDVRIAALQALAQLGEPSSVALLAKKAAKTEGIERREARNSLYAMTGEGIDEQVVKSVPKARGAIQVELVKAARERRLTGATPAVLELAKSSDAELKEAAFSALAILAEPQHLEAVTALATGLKCDEARASAEKALIAVARKAPGTERVAPILQVMNATKCPKTRASMLRVLGEVGDDAALDTLRAAINDADAGVKDAGVRALAEWPSPAVLDDLLGIAKATGDEVHRALALRGYVRLLAVNSACDIDGTIKRCEEIMAMATSADDTKAVLGSLANVKSAKALKLVEPKLEDEAVRAEAMAAMLKIALSISNSERPEAEAAANKILALAQDDGLKNQAQEVLNTIQKFDDYIVAWQLSGPYSVKGESGSDLFDVEFAPEKAKGGDAEWQVMPANTYPDSPYVMGLDKFPGGTNCVAYLATTIVCPVDTEARAELGSDDGVKVWVNGELVHGNNASRGCSPGEDKFSIKLKKGENALLVKVMQGGGEWALCLRIRNTGGSKIEGLTAKLPTN